MGGIDIHQSEARSILIGREGSPTLEPSVHIHIQMIIPPCVVVVSGEGTHVTQTALYLPPGPIRLTPRIGVGVVSGDIQVVGQVITGIE